MHMRLLLVKVILMALWLTFGVSPTSAAAVCGQNPLDYLYYASEVSRQGPQCFTFEVTPNQAMLKIRVLAVSGTYDVFLNRLETGSTDGASELAEIEKLTRFGKIDSGTPERTFIFRKPASGTYRLALVPASSNDQFVLLITNFGRMRAVQSAQSTVLPGSPIGRITAPLNEYLDEVEIVPNGIVLTPFDVNCPGIIRVEVARSQDDFTDAAVQLALSGPGLTGAGSFRYHFQENAFLQSVFRYSLQVDWPIVQAGQHWNLSLRNSGLVTATAAITVTYPNRADPASCSSLQEPTRVPTPRPTVGVTQPPPAPADNQRCRNPFVVRRGDTIWGIARLCGLDPNAIIAANPGIDPSRIEVGQQLALPSVKPSPTPRPSACQNPYTVLPGEWLYAIARKCGLSPQAIIAANPGINPSKLEPGQKLKLP